MPGLRSDEEILRAFDGITTVPGSKKPRREDNPVAQKMRRKILEDTNGWDDNPIIKTLNGKEVELFTVGAFAQALEKEVVTIRYWEKKGFIPIAPYRLRSKSLNGKKVNGNRVYTRDLIEITIKEFERRGLLGSARVEWKQHEDLTHTLVSKWKESVEKESQ
jgi:hypothetical protein